MKQEEKHKHSDEITMYAEHPPARAQLRHTIVIPICDIVYENPVCAMYAVRAPWVLHAALHMGSLIVKRVFGWSTPSAHLLNGRALATCILTHQSPDPDNV